MLTINKEFLKSHKCYKGKNNPKYIVNHETDNYSEGAGARNQDVYKRQPTKTLKLECIGDLRVKAGCGVVLMIKDLESDVPYNKYVIVSKVTHKFDNSTHTMSLEVKVV